MEGLFNTIISKFKSQYIDTIKSLQFSKLVRKINKNAGEWIGRIWLAAKECNYTEIEVKKQFIYGLNDNKMLTEIRELSKTKRK